MKAVIEQYVQLTAEKDAHITKTEGTLREFESESQRLRDAATRWANTPMIPSLLLLFFGAKQKRL